MVGRILVPVVPCPPPPALPASGHVSSSVSSGKAEKQAFRLLPSLGFGQALAWADGVWAPVTRATWEPWLEEAPHGSAGPLFPLPQEGTSRMGPALQPGPWEGATLQSRAIPAKMQQEQK